jgi:hypothetical protein
MIRTDARPLRNISILKSWRHRGKLEATGRNARKKAMRKNVANAIQAIVDPTLGF